VSRARKPTSGADGDDVTAAVVSENLTQSLQELGLRPYEARVLVTLLRGGSAGSAQLAQLSGVPRTSIYPVMKTLIKRGLATQIPSDGSIAWTCNSWVSVVDALDAAEEDRLQRHHARTSRLRQSLATVFPSRPSTN